MHATALTQQVSVAATPSGGTPAIATEGFRGLSQSLEANDGIMPRLRHDRRFTNPFLFIIHRSVLCNPGYLERRSGFQ
jgi:hypothetical protein